MATYTATHKDVDYTPSGVTASPQQKLDVWNGAAGQRLPVIITTGYSGWSKCRPKIDQDSFEAADGTADDREILDDDGVNIHYRVCHQLLERGDFVVVDVRLSIAMGAEISVVTPSYDNLNSPTIKPYAPFVANYDPNDLDATDTGTQQYGAAQNGYGVTNPPGVRYRTTVGAVSQGSPASTPDVTIPWDEPSWHMSPKDLRMAVDFLIVNADTYGIDPDRMIFLATSAGGLECLRMRKQLYMNAAQTHPDRIGKPFKPRGIIALDVPANLRSLVQQNKLGSPTGITGWMGPQGAQGHNPASGSASQWTNGDSAIAAPGIGDMDVGVLAELESWVEDPTYKDVPVYLSSSVAPELPIEQAKNLTEYPGTADTGLSDFHAIEQAVWLKAKGLASRVYYHNNSPDGDLPASYLDFIDGTLVNGGADDDTLTETLAELAVKLAYPEPVVDTKDTYLSTQAAITTSSSWQLVCGPSFSGARRGVKIHSGGAIEVGFTDSQAVEPSNSTGIPMASAVVDEFKTTGAVWVRATSGTPTVYWAEIRAGRPEGRA